MSAPTPSELPALLGRAGERLLTAAKGLTFSAYPAHGSGFVCVVRGDLGEFQDAIAEADQVWSAVADSGYDGPRAASDSQCKSEGSA